MANKVSRQILVVDDSELNRAILSELFHQSYDIVEAENGLVAIQKIEESQQNFIAILLDIIMPEMDGFSVLQYLAEHHLIEQIPVFLITAETSVNTALRGYEYGVVDIINKPIINPVIVRKRVNNAIELYQNKNQLEELVNRQVETIRQQTERLNGINISIIDILSSVIEFRSNESGQHVQHIRKLTQKILMKIKVSYPEYQLTDGEIEMLSNAAAMHDVGKISIPDYILNKPGKLTAVEFEEMKKHTLYGCDIIASIPFYKEEKTFQYCYDICRHHHERYDGKGYPDGLKGEEISIGAQAVSIADVYDALVSDRVYKKACSHEEALHMIVNGECGVFNPQILACFLEVAGELYHDLYEEEDQANTGLIPKFVVPVEPKAPASVTLSDHALELFERERQKTQWFNEMSGEILFDYNKMIDEIEFTEKFHEIFGGCTHVHHAEDYLEKCTFVPEEEKARVKKATLTLTPERSVYRTKITMNTAKHEGEWFELSLRALWGSSSKDEHICVGYIGKLVSVRKFQKETQQWQQKALHDFLTGALNRHALITNMKPLMSGELREEFSVLFLDLDGFKNINDTRGHLAGDNLLKKIAEVFRQNVRSSDLVARVGGDEFIIVLVGLQEETVVRAKAERLRTIIHDEMGEESISCSIGISRFPKDGEDLQLLLAKADKALYTAKHKGKNCCEFYKCKMENMFYQPALMGETEFAEGYNSAI